MDIYMYLTALIASFVLSVLFVVLSMRTGFAFNIVDNPNERKIHTKPIPRTGGIAIFLSFLVTFILIELIFDPITNIEWVYFFISLCMVFLLGLVDDIYDLPAKYKFILQIAISIFFSLTTFRIEIIYNLPFFEGGLKLGIFSVPITVFWLLFIMNAFNLIDGMDGLSSGLAAISSITFFVISVINHNFIISILSIILFGSLIGFLIFNFHPAKVFLGDNGSLLIGFILGTLSILELKQVTFVSFVVPFLILFIPMADTVYAIIRRKLKQKPIFQADKEHIHHCLLKKGFSQTKTALIIYGLAIFFSIGAIISTKTTTLISVVFLLAYFLFFQFIAKKIDVLPHKKNLK